MSSASKLSLQSLVSPSSLASHKSNLSENRYNFISEDLTEIQPTQEFSLKDIFPAINTHNRVLSQPIDVLTPELLFGHKRQKSLGPKVYGQIYDTSYSNTPKFEEDMSLGGNEQIRCYSHSRKVSDCDIVVYSEIKDNRSIEFERVKEMKSIEFSKMSLPVFGSNPCTAYCRECDKEVHTKVEFAKQKSLTFGILDAISSFFACCGEPTWLLKLRVHKCEKCGKVLARSCK